MNIISLTDTAIVSTIGNKVKMRRIAMRLSQSQLATNAGVSLSSVRYIESGKNSSLLTLIQVLRVLHSLDLLSPFTQEEPISPIAYAQMLRQQTPPKRVRAPKNVHSKN